MTRPHILGIDIGGSGIKGAIVDVAQGTLLTERVRLETPQPATPPAVAATVGELVRQIGWQGPVGCTFPAVIRRGVALTAANVDRAWIGTNAQELLQQATGRPFVVLNDADAAGIAECHFGAARNQRGVVMLLTFGTGIGSALLVDGRLVPNTELGHMEVRGKEAEQRASDRARTKNRLGWKAWAKHVDEVLKRFEALFWPDLFIIGGGVSKQAPRFLPHLTLKTPVVPAQLLNTAGIVGAALAAES